MNFYLKNLSLFEIIDFLKFKFLEEKLISVFLIKYMSFLLKYTGHFEQFFGLSGPYDIGNFIFNTVTRKDVYWTYPGMGRVKVYVYRFGNNYLQVVVGTDGNIITAYPSVTSKNST